MITRLITSILIISSLSFSQTLSDSSQELGAGIVYGSDHAFSLKAPEGWVLDNSSGVSQGLHAVFYPRGGSWQNSPAVMYAHPVSKKSKGNETIEKVIAYDVAQYKKSSAKISDSPPIKTGDNKIAKVKIFASSNYEAIAYIEEKTVTVILALTSQTQKDYQTSFSAFQELVKSYMFLTTNVNVSK